MPALRPAPDRVRREHRVVGWPRLARIFAGTTVAAVVLSLAPAPAGAAGSSVDPTTYIHSLCTTVSGYNTQVMSLQASAGIATSTNLTDVRDRLAALLSKVSSATTSVVADLKNAGFPNIKNGDKIAAVIVREFSALGDAFTKATKDARTLSTSNDKAFTSKAGAIDRAVTAAGNKAGHILSNVKNRYNTTALKAAEAQDPSCQGLK